MESIVQPILSPNAEAMTRQLQHLFGGDLDGLHDGLIELAWLDAKDGALRHAELFATDQIDELVARACRINAVPGQSCFIGAALRKPGTFPGGRCEDTDFYALPAYYVDLDDEGIAEQAKGLYRGCKPTLVVITGRRPHLRAQLWWRHETPERDPAVTRAQLVQLAAAFHGDMTVVNPSRVMRLAGSIAWPTKPGRVLEATELQTFDDRLQQYTNGELKRAFPVDPLLVQTGGDAPSRETLSPARYDAAPVAAPVAGGGGALALSPFTGTSPDELIARIRAGGGKWHENVLKLTGHWINRGWTDAEILTACEPLTISTSARAYTVADTLREVRDMLKCRGEWNIPNPAPTIGQEPKQIGEIEIMDLDAVAAIPPVTWLIEGYIPARGFGLVYGPPASCKSFLTLDMLLSVAYARPWHGRATVAGATLYIAGEGVGGLKKRIAAWRRHHGLLDVWTPFFVIRTGLNLTKPGTVDKLIAAIAVKAEVEGQAFAMIAIDTVARAMAGSDENSVQEMGAFIESCDRIRDAAGAAIVAVHHSGKDKDRGSRGSTALPGAVDTSIRVDRMEGASFITVKVEKQKDAEEVATATFHLAKVASGALDLDTETSLVVVDADGTMQAEDQSKGNKSGLTKQQAKETFRLIKEAWNSKEPLSMVPSLKLDGRYLPHVMDVAFKCGHKVAVEHIQAWVDGGYLVKDTADPKRHKTGYRIAQELN